MLFLKRDEIATAPIEEANQCESSFRHSASTKSIANGRKKKYDSYSFLKD